MPIRQLYYTSCRHPATGRTGFQVKAVSPGIAPGTLEALQRLLSYRIPPLLLETPPAAHPVALRYTPLSHDEAALVCIQSSGLDEFNRPGNYFAHAVIGPADEIARLYPPVTYWDSPFWVRRDDSPLTELPVLDTFSADVTFDFDAVWPFLNDGPRRTWLRALLGAVVTGQRAVIVDDALNVALWVYAVSMALPSRFRPMFSFATYHHDPLAAAFVVTGATPEGLNRPGGPGRFVLDVSGAVDAAPPSVFADYICDHFTPEAYDAEILEFLDWAEGRDDNATAFTLLDDLALFYLTTRRGAGGSGSVTAPGLERAARYVLDDAARTAGMYPQDAADLRATVTVYAELLAQTGSPEHLNAYERALVALARFDTDITDTAPETVRLHLGAVLDRDAALAASLRRLIDGLYAAEVVGAVMNQPDLLRHLTQLLRADDPQQVTLFWQHAGPYLRFEGAAYEPLVDALMVSLSALQPTPAPDPLTVPPPAAALLAALAAALSGHADLALRTAHFFQSQRPGLTVLEWLYYALVMPLPLRQRAATFWPYWSAFSDTADLRAYEIRRDLRAAGDSEALGTRVAEWHDALAAAGQGTALTVVMQAAWTQPRLDRRRFALAALAHSALVDALDSNWRTMLIDAALAGAAVETPDAATVELYSRIAANPRLPLTPAQRSAVEGTLALHSGRLPAGAAAASLRERLAALDASGYNSEAGQMLARFFTAEAHPDLIRALYVRQHRDAFWALYWQRFGAALLDERRIEDAAAVLDVWFARSAPLVTETPYALPEFFFLLPAALETLRTSRQYAHIARDFETQLAAYDWFPLVQKALQGKAGRGGLFGGLRER